MNTENKAVIGRNLQRVLLVLLASALMAVNIKTFVRTGGLYPGGATGLTVLIQRLSAKYLGFEIPYTPVNILLNAVPVYIGFRYIGKRFTLLSLMMILVNGFLVDLIPARVITYDTLLISIFGGLINGTVVSLCLRADATTGGTDFIAIFLSQKKGMETWNLILGLNVIILSMAGIFFGWDKALYSIIFQFVSTQTVHTLYRDYQQQTLIIVTKKPQEISDEIHRICHHGATIMDAEGSHEHGHLKLVYSVVSGSDAKKAIRAARQIDPKAFVNSIRTTELQGHFYMRPKD
jgi:uncharacterized membrane-anchored protein YitT (DUF2179 family)